jgi:hypothetical protein
MLTKCWFKEFIDALLEWRFGLLLAKFYRMVEFTPFVGNTTERTKKKKKNMNKERGGSNHPQTCI